MEHWKNLSLNDIDGEIWKSVIGYEGRYEVSNLGRVKGLYQKIQNKKGASIGRWHITHERIIKQRVGVRCGYLLINLNKEDTAITKKGHRLVAEAFIPNPENKPQVNHKKGIKTDNRASELEWSTPSENGKHAFKTGLSKPNTINKNIRGEKNYATVLTTEIVLDIKRLNRSGMKNAEIRKIYPQASKNTISNIIQGWSWSHVVLEGIPPETNRKKKT